MKKIFIVILVFAISICCANVSHPAYADNLCEWARIKDDSTALYTNPKSDKVTMTLAKSYYVKVLTSTEEYYQVEVMSNNANFPKIVGYVLISQVEQCSTPPIAPYYPEVYIVVSASSASLHLSPLASSNSVYTATNTQSMSYYGYINNAVGNWYYVYYCGEFGYVDVSKVTQARIPLHPTPLTPVAPPINPPAPLPPVTNPYDGIDSTGEILLIVFVCLLSLGLILALFLPHKNKPNNVTNAIWDRHI